MALTAPTSAPALGIGAIPESLSLPQKGSTTCYPGGLAVLDGGYAKPGATGLGLIAVGFFDLVEASANAGADGAVSVAVRPGTRRLANSGGDDAITQAHVGQLAFIVDDATVACRSAGTRSPAGRIVSVSSAGVYVTVGMQAGMPAALGSLGVQSISGTLVAGTCTIATGITVTAASRAIVVPSAAITGSTNFAQLAHLTASNVAGVPGTGSITITALGANGAADTDAAGTFHGVLIG